MIDLFLLLSNYFSLIIKVIYAHYKECENIEKDKVTVLNVFISPPNGNHILIHFIVGPFPCSYIYMHRCEHRTVLKDTDIFNIIEIIFHL